MKPQRSLLLPLLLLVPSWTSGQPAPPSDSSARADWLRDARYGVFIHFLPSDPRALDRVKELDAESLARQLASMGAGYLVLTLGQNSGYFNAPNSAYDQRVGLEPGERCATRDLPLDLHRVLSPRGIRLMLYLPCQPPNRDARAQKAFGLPEGPRDQPLDLEVAEKWARVIEEWSDRYGEAVAGWWFDGAYQHVRFNEAIARIYAAAARHGNPEAIVTFNPGVRLVRHTAAEDYTAGELNEPFDVLPASRWVDGSQWHALTYLGSGWSRRDTRRPAEAWARWAAAVTAKGGVVTLDMGPNWSPDSGPIGALAREQVEQVLEIKSAIRRSTQGTATTRGPQRLKRSESFLGMHFDFHAGPDCTEIGKRTTRAMVEEVIRQVRPDYIQIDCKGHPGLSSYPTRVGNPAPGFVGDPLRLWRDVTAEHGVALYMHYSGVWDSEAIRRHPQWGVIDADGKRNGNATSFFSPYAEELLIPQLRELAGDYGVDGAWVDGECWASAPDYGEAALEAFREATGLEDVPRKPGDPWWFEFLEFHREAFRAYLRRYIAEVKRTNPELQLCSNWAFTDHMPEPVTANVDFLSGDYSPEDSVNSARFSARYLARQGKPWDLMAWSFTHTPGKGGSNRKSAVQLEREAAVVLALGGGFQAYFTQRRDGSIREEELPVMAEVARFCRARQEHCHHAEAVPQVALLYSTAAHYREINGLFSRDLSRTRGTLEALLEGQQSIEVLGEHQLEGRLPEYPLVVVPESEYLEPRFRQQLLDHIAAGGRLLLVGPGAAALFSKELGAVVEAETPPADAMLYHEGQLGPLHGRATAVRLEAMAQPFGELRAGAAPESSGRPAASIAPLGRGLIAATYFSFSQGYLLHRSGTARAFLNALVRRLFPRPLVEVKGSADVDVAVTRVHGQLALQLVNTAGPHSDPRTPIFDSIPPVGPLEVLLRLPQRPTRITAEPGGVPLPFRHEAGETRLTLPSLEIHTVLLVH